MQYAIIRGLCDKDISIKEIEDRQQHEATMVDRFTKRRSEVYKPTLSKRNTNMHNICFAHVGEIAF
jgi:hypothetical protein